MKTDSEIKKDALIMGLLYSTFGFMGITIFYVWEFIIPSQTPELAFPLIYKVMFYIPLIVGLAMFWFSYSYVYKGNLKQDREFYALFKNDRQDIGVVN